MRAVRYGATRRLPASPDRTAVYKEDGFWWCSCQPGLAYAYSTWFEALRVATGTPIRIFSQEMAT